MPSRRGNGNPRSRAGKSCIPVFSWLLVSMVTPLVFFAARLGNFTFSDEKDLSGVLMNIGVDDKKLSALQQIESLFSKDVLDVARTNTYDSGPLSLNVIGRKDLPPSWVVEKPVKVSRTKVDTLRVNLNHTCSKKKGSGVLNLNTGALRRGALDIHENEETHAEQEVEQLDKSEEEHSHEVFKQDFTKYDTTARRMARLQTRSREVNRGSELTQHDEATVATIVREVPLRKAKIDDNVLNKYNIWWPEFDIKGLFPDSVPDSVKGNCSWEVCARLSLEVEIVCMARAARYSGEISASGGTGWARGGGGRVAIESSELEDVLISVPGEEVLKFFNQVQSEDVSPNANTLVYIVKSCSSARDLCKDREIHSEIIRQNLLETYSIGNALVGRHAKRGYAKRGYVDHGGPEEAIMCIERMGHQGSSANAFTLVSILKACSSTGWIRKGQEFHDEVIRLGFEKEKFVGSTLIDLFVKCNSLVEACKVFKESPIRILACGNAITAGYSDYGLVEEALHHYEQMEHEGISADAVTFVCCLKACATTRSLDEGRHLHCEITKRGLEDELPVGNILIDMYAKYSSLLEAKEVFEKLLQRNTISCTALIGGYVDCGRGEEALAYLGQMQPEGIALGPVLYICTLKACSSIGNFHKGQEMDVEIERLNMLERYTNVGTALLDFYASCGLLGEA